MTVPDKPIAILGAGIAGLSCATRLLAHGVAVELIEQGPTVGGRTTTPGFPWPVDLGAQYFTARDPAFLDDVAGWEAAGIVAHWQPRLVAFDGQALNPVEGGDRRLVGVPDMSAITTHLAQGLTVHLNTQVTALGRDDGDWIFDTAAHGVLDQNYSGVILTLPSQQALSLLVEASPAFADIAARSPMRGTWALAVRYDTDPALSFDAAFVNQGPLSWVAHDSSKPGRPAGRYWVLHAPAAEITGSESADEREEIAAAMIEAFMQLGAPRPDAWQLHAWLYAGSPGAPVIGSLWDPAERLGLAGDWLMGGRVEGAWRSGRQIADAVLASLDE